MDAFSEQQGFVGRLVSSLKDKTIKMAEDRLQKAINTEDTPEESILGIVASAVLAGATKLEVRVENSDLVLTHDGKPIAPGELQHLYHSAGALGELGRAVKLHLAQQDGKIDLEFLSTVGMHTIALTNKSSTEIADANLNDLKLAKMTTRVYLRGSGNYRRINQAMGNELPEVSFIRRRCFLAPLELKLLGKPLNRYGGLPTSFVTGHNFHRDPTSVVSALPTLPELGQLVELNELAPSFSAIKSGVCGVAKNAADAGWCRIRYGIAYPLSGLAAPPRSWGFLSLDDDVCSERVNQEIALLWASLLNELYLSCANRSAPTSFKIGEDCLTLLERERSTLLSLGHQAVDIDRTFLSLRQAYSPSSDARVLNSRLDLASTLESSGSIEEARRQYAEIVPVWESEAINHFDKYRYEEGAALWQKALQLHEKLGTDPKELAEKYLKLAKIGNDQRLGFAEQSYRRALDLFRGLPQQLPQQEMETLLGLAEVLKRNRVLTDSLRFAQDAEKLQLQLVDGRETKDLVPILKLQAEIYDLMGDYPHSTELEQKALLLKFKR